MVKAPVKTSVVVIYCPVGPLGDFLDELDTLLSPIPELDCPLLVLGDMNIYLDRTYTEEFLSLLSSFGFKLTKMEKY